MIPTSLSDLRPAPAISPQLQVVAGAPRDRRCVACCDWSYPLSIERTTTIHGVDVALPFTAWIAWHLHVHLHQASEVH